MPSKQIETGIQPVAVGISPEDEDVVGLKSVWVALIVEVIVEEISGMSLTTARPGRASPALGLTAAPLTPRMRRWK
jgi:hypothetical protein